MPRRLTRSTSCPEYQSEILLHLVQIEQRVPGTLVIERDQYIYIAIRPEIIAKYRAEQREFGDVPALAELGNLCLAWP